jgi:hypothetical protein
LDSLDCAIMKIEVNHVKCSQSIQILSQI